MISLQHYPSGTHRGSQLSHLATEAALIALAGFSAFLLRFEFEIPKLYGPHLKVALAEVTEPDANRGFRLGQRIAG